MIMIIQVSSPPSQADSEEVFSSAVGDIHPLSVGTLHRHGATGPAGPLGQARIKFLSRASASFPGRRRAGSGITVADAAAAGRGPGPTANGNHHHAVPRPRQLAASVGAAAATASATFKVGTAVTVALALTPCQGTTRLLLGEAQSLGTCPASGIVGPAAGAARAATSMPGRAAGAAAAPAGRPQ